MICKQDMGTDRISSEEKIRGCSPSQSEWVMQYFFPEQIQLARHWSVTLFLCLSHLTTPVINLRKQLVFHAPPLVFPLKWRSRNKQGNSILMACYYPDLVMVMPQGKFASTNQKHKQDLGSDTSSVCWPCSQLTTALLSGGGCPGCLGASTSGKASP